MELKFKAPGYIIWKEAVFFKVNGGGIPHLIYLYWPQTAPYDIRSTLLLQSHQEGDVEQEDRRTTICVSVSILVLVLPSRKSDTMYQQCASSFWKICSAIALPLPCRLQTLV
jgi:hypothetical protein